LIKSISPTLKYEPGVIVAEGDFVIVHGRFSGLGQPVNWIVADILRIEDGILVEHWDVIQDEASVSRQRAVFPCSATNLLSELNSPSIHLRSGFPRNVSPSLPFTWVRSDRIDLNPSKEGAGTTS
jgi:hypothetical protein